MDEEGLLNKGNDVRTSVEVGKFIVYSEESKWTRLPRM